MVKKGYKKTDIGIIPEDWFILSGSDVTSLIGKGSSPNWQGFKYTNSGMLFVTSENVRDGFLDISKPKYLPLEFHDKIKRTKLQKNDLLINLVGASIGRSCQVINDLGEANINQAVAVFRVNDRCCPSFLAAYFQWGPTIERIIGLQVDAARPNISLGNLRRFAIPIPPLAEQNAIAAALSDADALIASLDALIAKKRDLKQAAMQQLLTGKTRLPGFKGKWVDTTVGTIADVKTGPFGTQLHEQDYVNVGTPIITVEHLGEFGINISEGVPLVSDADRKRLQAYELTEGDIVFSRVGSVDRNGLVGKNEGGWLFSGRLLRVRLKPGVVPSFLSFLFHSAPFKAHVISVAVGQTMPCLNTKILKAIPIRLPKNYNEQTAIANLLSDLDADLAALEAKRDKARAIKQGMMQELLTGRIRLV